MLKQIKYDLSAAHSPEQRCCEETTAHEMKCCLYVRCEHNKSIFGKVQPSKIKQQLLSAAYTTRTFWIGCTRYDDGVRTIIYYNTFICA